MTELLHKSVEWEWTDKRQQAFDKLKQAVKAAPILTITIPNKQFTVITDASRYS